MTTVNCSGNEELDFRLIFAEDAQQHSLGPTGVDPDDSTLYYTQSLVNQPISEDTQSHHPTPAPLQTHSSYDPSYEVHSSRYSPMGHPKAFDCPSIQITSIAPNPHQDVGTSQDAVPVRGAEGECSERSWSRDHLYLPLDPCYRDSTLSPSPCSSLSSRSWLSDVSSCESFSHVYDDVEAELNEAAARFTLGGSPLASPLASPGCSPQAVGNIGFGVELWQQQYQHPLCFTQSLSPHQSPRQSPCHSPHHSPRTSVTDENWLNPRPTSRSSSRPTSPCGKRRHSSADVYARSPSPHHSPSPTPGHSPRGSVTEDTWGGISAAAMGPLQYSYPEVDVPSKTRRTSAAHMALLTGLGDAGLEDQCAGLPYLDLPVEESVSALKQDDGLAELFLSVPSHFTWNKPKPGNAPLFRTSSLPPLDWPLPSQFGQCELKMEVQPRSHHRAHYETEGSRGAVKATSGGHPVVKLIGYNEKPVNLQVFIGTADDRYLRPHAFYQVHRVTGKTVSTTCQENIISCTKVLEIPLLPENNMSTSIDCAGILKLRNSDIELRKGETDIGRKNTRVRIAFRVHIPQPNGKVLCLQAASIPVECSQRSAQELPHVERFSPVNCSVAGGEEMVITGSNISPESKVIFQEKGPDGRTLWEVDAKVMRDKSNGSSIVVVIPPYYNKTVGSAVQVQFYVCHGKRRRSLTQNFTYLADTTDCRTPATDCAAVSPLVKQEHRDSVYPPGLYPASTQLPSPDHAFPQDRSLYGSSGHPVPCAQPSQTAYSPLGSSPLQHSPHLHGCSPSMGYKHQRISSMHTVDPTPATRRRSPYQATQPGMPYSGQPSASMRSAPPQVSQPMSAQAKTSGSSSHREGMMFLSHISLGSDLQAPGSDLQSTTSQARDRTSTQLHSLSYHGSHSGSAQGAPLQTEHSLSYHSARDASASYSPNHAADPSVPPTATSGVPPRHLPPSLGPSRASLISVDLRKHPPAPHSLFSNSEERVNIKQEPEEKLTLGSMGLQEITLDDVNEIIDRDISQLSGGAELIQSGQDNLGWDQNSSDTAQPFCGLH